MKKSYWRNGKSLFCGRSQERFNQGETYFLSGAGPQSAQCDSSPTVSKSSSSTGARLGYSGKESSTGADVSGCCGTRLTM